MTEPWLPKAAGRRLRPQLAAYCGPDWPGITALLAGYGDILQGSNLVEATNEIQLTLYPEDKRREKWEKIDRTVEALRNRYGYTAIQKALLFTDPILGAINPREDHTVHPVGYFGG